MSYHYTDEKRVSEPYALPDVEVYRGWQAECSMGCEGYDYHVEDPALTLATCNHCGEEYSEVTAGWFYQYGMPGYMPDSDPSGPYPTEAAALEAAREAAGYCPHGMGDDDPCEACDEVSQ